MRVGYSSLLGSDAGVPTAARSLCLVLTEERHHAIMLLIPFIIFPSFLCWLLLWGDTQLTY